MKVREEMHQDL